MRGTFHNFLLYSEQPSSWRIMAYLDSKARGRLTIKVPIGAKISRNCVWYQSSNFGTVAYIIGIDQPVKWKNVHTLGSHKTGICEQKIVVALKRIVQTCCVESTSLARLSRRTYLSMSCISKPGYRSSSAVDPVEDVKVLRQSTRRLRLTPNRGRTWAW